MSSTLKRHITVRVFNTKYDISSPSTITYAIHFDNVECLKTLIQMEFPARLLERKV